MPYISIEIQKVLELEGAIRPDFNCPTSLYAHISKPVKRNRNEEVQYALIAIFPQHGIMELGEINPATRVFRGYDPRGIDLSFYERASNNVIKEIKVLGNQVRGLKTLDEVLAIEGISVKRELIPGENPKNLIHKLFKRQDFI